MGAGPSVLEETANAARKAAELIGEASTTARKAGEFIDVMGNQTKKAGEVADELKTQTKEIGEATKENINTGKNAIKLLSYAGAAAGGTYVCRQFAQDRRDAGRAAREAEEHQARAAREAEEHQAKMAEYELRRQVIRAMLDQGNDAFQVNTRGGGALRLTELN